MFGCTWFHMSDDVCVDICNKKLFSLECIVVVVVKWVGLVFVGGWKPKVFGVFLMKTAGQAIFDWESAYEERCFIREGESVPEELQCLVLFSLHLRILVTQKPPLLPSSLFWKHIFQERRRVVCFVLSYLQSNTERYLDILQCSACHVHKYIMWFNTVSSFQKKW